MMLCKMDLNEYVEGGDCAIAVSAFSGCTPIKSQTCLEFRSMVFRRNHCDTISRKIEIFTL